MTDAAVLTYHRIIDAGRRPEFYDVPWAIFEQQIALIAARTTRVEGIWIRLDNGRAVMLSFDDGTADHARAGAILAEYGLPGTFFVVGGRVDATGFLTRQNIEELAAVNHHIASHSMTHRQLPTLEMPEIVSELGESKAALEAIVGRDVTWLAPPGGAYDDKVLSAAKAAGYEVVRSMDWGYTSDRAKGLMKCLPVFRSYDDAMVERLIDGRAPLWRYHAKSAVKRIVSDKTYHRLRGLVARDGRGATR